MRQVAWILALLSVIASYTAMYIYHSAPGDEDGLRDLTIDFKCLTPQFQEEINAELSHVTTKSLDKELDRLFDKLEVLNDMEKQLLTIDLPGKGAISDPSVLTYYLIKPAKYQYFDDSKSYEVYYPEQNLILKYTRISRCVERPFATISAADQNGKLEVMHCEYIKSKWILIKPDTTILYGNQ